MKSWIATVVILGLATASRAQFLQNVSGYNEAEALDAAEYYDANGNVTYLDGNDEDNSANLGEIASAINGPWQATFAQGGVSGNGEAASASGVFSSNALSASLSTFLAANSSLSSTLASAAPYYGVAVGDFGRALTWLDFSTTQATSLTLSGSFTGVGDNILLQVDLFDDTSSTETVILSANAGAYPLNSSLSLASGHDYRLGVGLIAFPRQTFDPNTNVSFVDTEGATGSLTATFAAAPAPEPATCVLVFAGVVGLVRRRQRTR